MERDTETGHNGETQTVPVSLHGAENCRVSAPWTEHGEPECDA